MKYTKLKFELQELAERIKALKSHRKENNRGEWKLWQLEYNISKMKYEFRHKHIAYCLLRGTEYDQVEKPAGNNAPNMEVVNRYMEQHSEKQEDVRAGS